MPQQIVVDSQGEWQVIETGPVGPAGPQGLPGNGMGAVELTTRSAAEVIGGAEFQILWTVDDEDGPLYGLIGAKIDMTGFGAPGKVITPLANATWERDRDTNLPSGRIMVEYSSIDANPTEGEPELYAHRSSYVTDLKIVNLFAPDEDAIGSYYTRTPFFDGEAANKAYVDSRLVRAGVIDIREYGAVMDGVTDDWDAIRDAINEAQDTGKDVFIPPGTTLVRKPIRIRSGVNVRGAGMGISNITKRTTVEATITQKVFAGDTAIHVDSVAGFQSDTACHIYDTSFWEGGPPFMTVANINVDDPEDLIINIFPPAEGEVEIGGKICTSHALVINYFPFPETDEYDGWLGTNGGSLSDVTLDQNAGPHDPAGSYTGGGSQVDFVRASLHLQKAHRFLTERVEFVNIPGDAYSDQGYTDDSTHNENTIRDCRVVAPFRHGLHIGTTSTGARVLNNEITGCGDGYSVFFCAYALSSLISGNYIKESVSGIGGIDTRDKFNRIVDNYFFNCSIPISTSGGPGGPDGPFGLVVDGNVFYNDTNTPAAVSIGLGLPNIVFSNNRLHNTPVHIVGDRCVIEGNVITVNMDAYPLGLETLVSFENADDVVFTGNILDGGVKGVEVINSNRLRATDNKILNMVGAPFSFAYYESVDCVIDGATTISYVTDGGLVGSASRLIQNGLGYNGTDDPSLAGDWFGVASNARNGVMVHWNDSGTDTISMFISGVGWITIGAM